jgi:hypothetical protein
MSFTNEERRTLQDLLHTQQSCILKLQQLVAREKSRTTSNVTTSKFRPAPPLVEWAGSVNDPLSVSIGARKFNAVVLTPELIKLWNYILSKMHEIDTYVKELHHYRDAYKYYCDQLYEYDQIEDAGWGINPNKGHYETWL